jgi:teichuronic acid biosynthesis glycosyltransferase TuaG
MKTKTNIQPLVSVVIPVYNDEQYIQECVESALNQDYENLEVIVVDDGSSDSTPKILKRFGEKIHCIHQKNRGTAAALNTGIQNANGGLIAWLSSDDLFLPKKIEHQTEKFRENPFLELVYTDWIMIDSQGNEVKTVHCPFPPAGRFVFEMLRNNFVNGSSVIIRRECFEKVGYFDETLPADSDGDMWFRMLKQGCHFGHVPLILVKRRWHTGNLSHNYKLAESSKDQVRVRALQNFSKEIFGDTGEKQVKDIDSAYEKLALTFARQWLFRAAGLAMTKAIHNGFCLKRRLLRLMFRIMRTEPLLSLVLLLRKIRFWFLAQCSSSNS